ncbi:hypothetical protein CPB86DRAFT_702154 [Serendipita vermifera]|nr:hypothetical protein CPB86DRAFT_702154 [Serendipita vermifera]
MEAFPRLNDGLITPSPSSTPTSTRKTSRASSSSPGRAKPSPSPSSLTPPSPITQPATRKNQNADLLIAPGFDRQTEMGNNNLSGDMGHSERLTARPRNKRHHTSEASPPSALLRSPVNQLSQSSKRRARQDSPSPGARTPYGSLYPPKGEKRKRTASLNDLHLSTDRNPLWLAIQPPPLPLPLPASILPTTSHIETSPSKRSSQHGVRRWHALMELVSTEEGYVRDLKILVRIYLEQLSSVVSLEEDARAEISRNSGELLALHKKVLRRLQRVITEEQVEKVKPATTQAERKVEKAIKRVAGIFIKEAASFHLYESFCAGHSQALDLIRQVRGLPEWDMYEKRCAVIVADERANVNTLITPDPNSREASEQSGTPAATRRHSTDIAPKESISLPHVSKLTMQDFLIKPIQRICRYPLILTQLQQGEKSLPSSPTSTGASHWHSGTSLEMAAEAQALEAMRQVAAKVDDARRRTDIAIKTRLISERVPEQALPQLTSQGTCLLSGSLDIIYYHETIAPLTTPVKVKYMGVFLYEGWLLIVKVLKNKTYEPRHWFPLASVTLSDIHEDDALLPSSFRLSSGDHYFECAAACVQEKNLWMRQITEVKNLSPASITTFSTSLEDRPLSPAQAPTRTPTRKSTSPLPFTAISESIASHASKRRFSLGAMEAHEISPVDPSSKDASEPVPPVPTASQSDNLATPAQMKTLLEGEMPTILIRRSSTNYRKMVDQCLGDVFSEECQAVRLQAQMKEALFQPPKLTTDSGSALAARNRMTKRDSILVKRQRSTVDATPQSITPLPKNGAAAKFALVRNKSAHAIGSAKELRRRTLAIPSFAFFEEREEFRGRGLSARPNTADSSAPSSQPSTPLASAVEPLTQSDFLTFSTKRHRPDRNSIADPESLENGSQRESKAIEIGALRDLNLLKDLPEIPKPKRRSTIMISSSLRNSDFGSRFSTISVRRSVERHNSDGPVYSVGQGLSNLEPDHSSRSLSSRLNPGKLFRKSMDLINLKRNFTIPSGYFNRSKANLSVERDDDASLTDRTRSEPPPSPVNHISKSTPAFHDSLTAWEIVPNMKLSRPDNKRAPSLGSASSTDHHHTRDETPPVPPLPLYAQTLHVSKSSLGRRSSQFIKHHLGKLNHSTPTNT